MSPEAPRANCAHVLMGDVELGSDSIRCGTGIAKLPDLYYLGRRQFRSTRPFASWCSYRLLWVALVPHISTKSRLWMKARSVQVATRCNMAALPVSIGVVLGHCATPQMLVTVWIAARRVIARVQYTWLLRWRVAVSDRPSHAMRLDTSLPHLEKAVMRLSLLWAAASNEWPARICAAGSVYLGPKALNHGVREKVREWYRRLAHGSLTLLGAMRRRGTSLGAASFMWSVPR